MTKDFLKSANIDTPFQPMRGRRMPQDRDRHGLGETSQVRSVNADVSCRPMRERTLLRVPRKQPRRIVLFGSYGYGSPTPDSDVDLLVIMDTNERPADRYLAVSRLIRPRPFPLDILVKTPSEIARALEKGDFFIREIVTQGRTLYERSD